jgi:hypothetical protein
MYVLALATLTLEVTFELLLIRDEGLNGLLVNQYLFRERKTQGFPCWLLSATVCSVFNIVDHKQTILAASEEEVIIVADPHAFDRFAMSLYLVNFS